MVLVFVESADTFRVDNEHFVSVNGHRFVPHPQSFGTRINGRSDPKPLSLPIFIKQNPIQKKRFSSSVLASHCDDPEVLIEKILACKELSGLIMKFKAYKSKFKLVYCEYSKKLVSPGRVQSPI